MKKLLILLLFCSCTAQTAKIVEDIIEGEAKIAEEIIQDVNGIPHQ